MHDGCATREDLQAQSDRHHRALTDINRTTGAMEVSIKRIEDHLIGTFDKPGFIRVLDQTIARIDRIEAAAKISLWQDLKVTALRAIVVTGIIAGFQMLLIRGFKDTVREIIMDTPRAVSMARKHVPNYPTCPGCSPTVAAAE